MQLVVMRSLSERASRFRRYNSVHIGGRRCAKPAERHRGRGAGEAGAGRDSDSSMSNESGPDRFHVQQRPCGAVASGGPSPHFSPGCERGRGDGQASACCAGLGCSCKANASQGAQAYSSSTERACEASGIEHPDRVQCSKNRQIRVRSRDLGRNAGWQPGRRDWTFPEFARQTMGWQKGGSDVGQGTKGELRTADDGESRKADC